MKQYVTPAFTIVRICCCIDKASGVVCVAGIDSLPIFISIVLSSPHNAPSSSEKRLNSNVLTVVLPLVPVTPTTVISCEGFSYQLLAIALSAMALLRVTIYCIPAVVFSGICSHTMAVAPETTACSIKL